MIIWDILFQGRSIHYIRGYSLKAYPLKYTVIYRLVRLEKLDGGH